MPHIHLSLLDLPPPDSLLPAIRAGPMIVIVLTQLGLILIVCPDDRYTIYQPAAQRSVPYLSIVPHSLHSVAYHGYALPLALLRLEDHCYASVQLRWDTVSQQFVSFFQKDSATMPRKATATETATAPIQERPAASVSTPSNGSAETKAKAPKEPKVIVPPKPYETGPVTWKGILASKYNRTPCPISWEDIQRCVCPEYADIAATAQAEQEAAGPDDPLRDRLVEILPDKAFMQAFCKANVLNRPRNWPHVERLGDAFFADFDPAATHWVLTRGLNVGNGGHSAPAYLNTFFHSTDEELALAGVDPKLFKAKLRWESAQDAEEGTIDIDRRVNLVLNARHDSVLKMEDLRLSARDIDYVAMVPQLMLFLEKRGIEVREMVQWTNGLWKYTDPKTEKDGVVHYAQLNRGGRLSAQQAPIRCLLWSAEIAASLEELRSHFKGGQFYAFCKGLQSDKEGNGLTVKDAMIALASVSQDQRKRLAKALTTEGALSKYLHSHLNRPASGPAQKTWIKKDSDKIVACLIAFARRGDSSLDDDNTCMDPQNPKNRAEGWGSGDAQDGVLRSTSVLKIIEKYNDFIDASDMLENAELTAKREERAQRQAAGGGRKPRNDAGKPRK